MTPRSGIYAILMIGFLAIGIGANLTVSRSAPAPLSLAALPAAGQPPRVAAVGAASCSGGAGCHAKRRESSPPSWDNAHIIWQNYDKHALAFAALEPLTRDGKPSLARRIVQHLGWGDDARLESRCLACHATPQLAHDPKQQHLLREGVGCEACHGIFDNYDKWRSRHYGPDWLTHRRTGGYPGGLVWMNRPTARLSVCVGCHVGAASDERLGLPLREVNHDMIAAGHPRLTTERLRFDPPRPRDQGGGGLYGGMPRHWREINRLAAADAEWAPFDLETRCWLAAQIETTRATLALAEDQARHAGQRPWPEFTQSECFACHHDLRDPSWRQSTAHYGSRQPGALPWSEQAFSWPMRRLATPSATTHLDAFVREMSQPLPHPKRTAELARTARAECGCTLPVNTAWDEPTLVQLLDRWKWSTNPNGSLPLAGLSREQAVQIVLALEAVDRSTNRRSLSVKDRWRTDYRQSADVQALLSALHFPAGFDSPRSFRSTDADLTQFGKQVDQLRERLRSQLTEASPAK